MHVNLILHAFNLKPFYNDRCCAIINDFIKRKIEKRVAIYTAISNIPTSLPSFTTSIPFGMLQAQAEVLRDDPRQLSRDNPIHPDL